MYDISTIHRINRRAVLEEAERARNEGHFVAAIFQGLNIDHFRTFDSPAKAVEYVNKYAADNPGAHGRVLSP